MKSQLNEAESSIVSALTPVNNENDVSGELANPNEQTRRKRKASAPNSLACKTAEPESNRSKKKKLSKYRG